TTRRWPTARSAPGLRHGLPRPRAARATSRASAPQLTRRRCSTRSTLPPRSSIRGGAGLADAFAVAETHGLEANGIWTVAEQEQAWANGADGGAERRTDAFMKVICIAPSGRSGYVAQSTVAAGDISAGGMAERAARKALADGKPAEVPPGDHTVVFEAHAVGTL